MKTSLWNWIGPWEIRTKQAPPDDHHATLFEQLDQSDNNASFIACYIYQSYCTLITLVYRAGSLSVYLLLYVHDMLNMGQISPGCRQLRDTCPSFRLESAGFRVHRIATCHHRPRGQRQEGWERWCRSEQSP
jgi:hypothetical protein